MKIYELEPTKKNFDKIRKITSETWSDLSAHKKLSYWNLHKKYPENRLLDDLVKELNLNDENVERDARKSETERLRSKRTEPNVKYEGNVKKEILELNSKISTLKEKLKNSESMVTTLTGKVTELQNNRIEYEIKLTQNERVTNSLSTDYNNYKVKTDAVLDKYGKSIKKIQKEMSLMKNELDFVRSELAKRTQEIERLREEKDNQINQLREETNIQIMQVRREKDNQINTLREETTTKITQVCQEKDAQINQLREEKDNEIAKLQNIVNQLTNNYTALMLAHQQQVEKNANKL